jgi:hypothetical protein
MRRLNTTETHSLWLHILYLPIQCLWRVAGHRVTYKFTFPHLSYVWPTPPVKFTRYRALWNLKPLESYFEHWTCIKENIFRHFIFVFIFGYMNIWKYVYPISSKQRSPPSSPPLAKGAGLHQQLTFHLTIEETVTKRDTPTSTVVTHARWWRQCEGSKN